VAQTPIGASDSEVAFLDDVGGIAEPWSPPERPPTPP
jgi:hypothetical protein